MKAENPDFDVEHFRTLFPAFRESPGGRTLYFDAVGGTQVPYSVISAISRYLTESNGNKGGTFRRSKATDEMVEGARFLIAAFLNVNNPNEVILGPNFTSLTFHLSRSISSRWLPGDEIILSRLDHDANVSPWVRAAEDSGVTVKYVDIDDEIGQLKYGQLEELLSSKTKLVAFCAASSAIGTRPDVARVVSLVRKTPAVIYLDAVALAPHCPIDQSVLNVDFIGFSFYKIFGPHVSAVWGRGELLEDLKAYNISSSTSQIPQKWMNGAAQYELIAGAVAALRYIQLIGKSQRKYLTTCSSSEEDTLLLKAGMSAIERYESELAWHFISEILIGGKYLIHGVTNKRDWINRVPTICLSLPGVSADKLAAYLASVGIDTWSRSVYSSGVFTSPTLRSMRQDGFIRVGIVHYNTMAEVNELLTVLHQYAKEI